MTVAECAFPQPVTPSGYELNTDNAGLTKLEWLACKMFVAAWKPGASAAAEQKLIEDCWTAADRMLGAAP